MATQLQEDLAEAIIKNRALPRYKRKTKGQLLRDVGYGGNVSKKKPGEIIEQKGVQEAIEERTTKKGLTKEFITDALVEDIEGKPKRRVRELELGAAILGMTDHEKEKVNKTLILVVTGETASRYGVEATRIASEGSA